MEKRVAFFYDDVFLRHRTPEWHPESPARLVAVNEAVKRSEFCSRLAFPRPRKATAEEILLVHDAAYVKSAAAECRQGRASLSTGDVDICPESFEVALWAAGAVLAAVDTVVQGAQKRAFCAVRPPGHHAGPARGMGFCILNNVAIAARYAQKRHGLERILIADWDVHHGNGTQDVFCRDGSVLFMSTHQWPLYPGTGRREETGEGRARGMIMNRPFPPGTGNAEIVAAFRGDLLPVARVFKPELTLISAGFDSRRGDPLGGFCIDDEGFRELTRIMIEISEVAGKGRLVSVLEGGYNLPGLAAGVCAHLDLLVGG